MSHIIVRNSAGQLVEIIHTIVDGRVHRSTRVVDPCSSDTKLVGTSPIINSLVGSIEDGD